MNNRDPEKRPNHTLLKAGTTVDEMCQMALDMFKAVQGREPTEAELDELEATARKLKGSPAG
jgi:hypothetical protein